MWRFLAISSSRSSSKWNVRQGQGRSSCSIPVMTKALQKVKDDHYVRFVSPGPVKTRTFVDGIYKRVSSSATADNNNTYEEFDRYIGKNNANSGSDSDGDESQNKNIIEFNGNSLNNDPRLCIDDYMKWNKDLLKELCRFRSLKVKGNKNELVCRLGEYNNQERIDEYCFDKFSNYQLVHKSTLDENKEGRMLLSPRLDIVDETASLLDLVPSEFIASLRKIPGLSENLMEIVLDVGRKPYAWIKDERLTLSEEKITSQILQDSTGCLDFGSDNRASLDGCLHRISAIRNRSNQLVGATLRAGRYIPGNAIMIIDILLGSNASVLFVGPPGSAKTSIIRDAANILSEHKSVVIVDTSNEISGSGDIPHECIGRSRRMQVPNLDRQAAIMVECVQNHTPEVIIIDEIGRKTEVSAALTCKERGVRIIASAHGDLAGLIRNTALCDLVGGVSTVTVGDMTARRDASIRGGRAAGMIASKLRTERRGPPIFDVVVELKRNLKNEWQVVLNSAAAVDSILKYGTYISQIRTRTPSGEGPLQIREVEHDTNRSNKIEEQLNNLSNN
jgi:stage III sporulation protein SpoIIIAA